MTRTQLVALAAVLSAAPACARCGSSDDRASSAGAQPEAGAPSRIGSCDRVSTMSVCSEYAGAYLAHEEPVLTATCQRLSGTFVYAECPNTAVIGSCALATGEARKFYSSGAVAYDAARAKRECETSYRGTWKPFD